MAESETILLEDGISDSEQNQIDYVLAWEEPEEPDEEDKISERKREIFIENLKCVGLIVAPLESGEEENVKFVRIQAPKDVLRRYAEILKFRKPMKKVVDVLPDEIVKLTAIYTREREFLFNVEEPNFFTVSERATIIDFILSRTRYSEDEADDSAFGLQRLRKDGVYAAAYPLHDEDIRRELNLKWASLRKGCGRQDLDLVKEYFGVKIGLYFAWLGFYTHMLIPAAIVGLICFLYGVVTLFSDQHSMDICNSNITDPMCPLCNNLCDYWDISSTCSYTRITYLFDNDATFLFAFIMSVWSAIFLECWKRYSAEISHRWDLTAFDVSHEQPRPEFYQMASRRNKNNPKMKLNRITMDEEPSIRFWRQKMPFTVFSLSVVLFLVLLPVAAMLGVIVYRLAVAVAMSALARKNPGVYSWSLIVVNNTAAIINLIVINIFNWVYSVLAAKLTELEMHRTQTSFDNSLTLKMYLLQFVNCYSSIVYVAFFKGKFVGTPHKYTMAFGFRQEECAPGGCMTELCIQLATIMIGNQIINAVTEVGVPWILKKVIGLKNRICSSKKPKEPVISILNSDSPQWVSDYALLNWDEHSLFGEYLEMVIQYGFVTIFVAAFPLAPLFALLNNIFELRLDAKKFLNNYKRPVAQRVKDIGTWSTILSSVSNLAVCSNAFIIALTSNFIPKLVYRLEFGSLDGFLEHSLAYFNTSDPKFQMDTSPLQSRYGVVEEVKVCRYQSYRDYYFLPADKKFDRTTFYWEVWMYRLVFVILFQNFVTLIVVLVKWLIPDIPAKLNDRIRQENYWTMEAVILHEANKLAKEGQHQRKVDRIVNKRLIRLVN